MGAIGVGIELAQRVTRARAAPVFDFSSGVMPPGASLTRASPGTRYAADGMLVSEAVNGARFDHDPATGTLRGLLLEPARTNLAPQARFDPTAWTLSAGTALNSTTAAGIDGAPRAASMTINSDSGQQLGVILPAALAGGATFVLSWFVRSSTMTKLGSCGYFYNAGSVQAYLGMKQGGWQRITMPIVTDGSIAASPNLRLHGYSGSAVGEPFLCDWVQIELGPEATSPILTTGATATRAVDRLTLDWGILGAADGAVTIRYAFDDGSSQAVAAEIIGGKTTVPALARPWLRRAELI